MIKKGINIGGVYTINEIETELSMASNCGFDFVEICLEGNVECHHWESIQHEFNELLSKYQLTATAHLPWIGLDLGSPRDVIRDASIRLLKEYIQVAEKMGTDKGIMHLSSEMERVFSDEVIIENMVKSVTELEEYCETRDFEISFENTTGFATADTIHSVLSNTPSSMTLDTGHARAAGLANDSFPEYVDNHINRIDHLHINDTRDSYLPEDEHLPFGAGDIDFESIFEVINSNDWNGTVLLELQVDDQDYISLSKSKLDRYIN